MAILGLHQFSSHQLTGSQGVPDGTNLLLKPSCSSSKAMAVRHEWHPWSPTAEAMYPKHAHHSTTVLAIVWLTKCGSQMLQSSHYSYCIIFHVGTMTWGEPAARDQILLFMHEARRWVRFPLLVAAPKRTPAAVITQALWWLEVGALGGGAWHSDPNPNNLVLHPALDRWHFPTSFMGNVCWKCNWGHKEKEGLHNELTSHHTGQEVVGTRLSQ